MRVLIADDDARHRRLLATALAAEGHETAEAVDGVDALEKLRTGGFDAVISDVLMPRMDGYRLGYEVRRSKDLENTRIIVYSRTYASLADERMALRAGADRFLRSPLGTETILRALRDAARDRRPRRAVVAPAIELATVREYSEVLVGKLESANRNLEASTRRLARANEALKTSEARQHAVSDTALKSEERFRRLFDSNTIGIVIGDLSGHMSEANDAFLDMVGFSRADLLAGKVRWTDLTPPEHRERTRVAIEEVQRTGTASPWEKEYVRKDGTRVPVLIGIALLKASEGSCIAYIVDLTERRRLEDQFRQAQKMEAVGQLAGGVAHDFNNLLTVILGYAELLAATLGPGSTELEALDQIREAGGRAASLTRQLLTFSRQQVIERKVLDVSDLIAHTEKMLRRLIGEDVELVSVLDPAPRCVFADPGQIEQVIMNLAVNARDAMPRGGRLTIETANVELDEEYARLHATVRSGSYVMIAVSDTGVGMSGETLAHMFEPFFTTKERGKGTGLGLATVYGIVKQCGGSVWVYSEVGKGTTVKIYLPLAEEDRQAEPVAAAEPASLAGAETVLLVEDEASVRALSASILNSRGYTVLEAASGKEGLDVARHYPLPIQLLLTDVVMPEMGGSDLASRLAALRPGMRVLYMSGYTDDAVFRHGLLEKGLVFLQKPFTPETLARKVREALGG